MKQYLKSLNLKYLLGLIGLVLVLAILNNIRSPEERSVRWVGSQEVLETPEGY